ncbi:MAG: hypothetical protein E7G49_00110 [Cutibacterium granulosum]|uniref:C-terminal of methylmalonyl-CoA carboxyltransferase n=1 Tax=Cutibacterium granulosum TM11 TaxID=1292373 RepID=A0ACB4UMF8_9ACTN|nr:hypothetical protein [Cutibacterium granulosum]ERF64062.1 C-terminal of methylmalonyl-CoA carboxyltransferase [Cutibacterium granulosum TM11]MDU3767223.1 hypothetical protein [Cutibacterium granulosum]
MTDNDKDRVIESLTKRLDCLEAEVGRLRASSPGIPEDVLVAISAAVSAYLGNDGKVQAVRFAPSGNWTRQGRRALQNHSIR